MQAFIFMYRPHAACEDTDLFPKLREIVQRMNSMPSSRIWKNRRNKNLEMIGSKKWPHRWQSNWHCRPETVYAKRMSTYPWHLNMRIGVRWPLGGCTVRRGCLIVHTDYTTSKNQACFERPLSQPLRTLHHHPRVRLRRRRLRAANRLTRRSNHRQGSQRLSGCLPASHRAG